MSEQVKPYFDMSKLIDERCFEIGEIYYIKDELIDIPDADRIQTPPRNIHKGRMVVIAHNHEQNYNKFCPIVTIAPLSHKIEYKRSYDLEIDIRDVIGNLKYKSLIRLPLLQPVLKVDIERCIGTLKDYKIEELIAMQMEMLGIE